MNNLDKKLVLIMMEQRELSNRNIYTNINIYLCIYNLCLQVSVEEEVQINLFFDSRIYIYIHVIYCMYNVPQL